MKVFLADHQYLVRVGLRHILARDKQMEVVGEASNSTELMEGVKKHKPDVILIDYYEKNSFSLTDIDVINRNYPKSKFVVITADENKDSINKTLSFGVNAFLTKTCDKEEIKSAIMATSKGEKFFCNKILDILLAKHLGDVDNNCNPTELTVREVEIVKLIGKGYSSKKIAEYLNLSLHTINTHRKNVMKKLKLKSVSELMLYAINMGLSEN